MSLFVFWGGGTRVDQLRCGVNDWLDQTFLVEHGNAPTCERAVDLHPVRDDRHGDELVARHFLSELGFDIWFEEDGVGEGVTCLTLGPLLLLAALLGSGSLHLGFL